MKIQIKNRWSGVVIFETDAKTIGDAVVIALKAGANLRGADLGGANLRGANLGGANLRSANLRGANLRSADKAQIVSQRTILPDGVLTGWKKLAGGVICKLRIPEEAARVGGVIGRKCRAEFAIVVSGEGRSIHNSSFSYVKNKKVVPASFDSDPFEECAPGIHFFITREEAENYN